MNGICNTFNIMNIGDIGFYKLPPSLHALVGMLPGFQGMLEALSDALFGVSYYGFCEPVYVTIRQGEVSFSDHRLNGTGRFEPCIRGSFSGSMNSHQGFKKMVLPETLWVNDLTSRG